KIGMAGEREVNADRITPVRRRHACLGVFVPVVSEFFRRSQRVIERYQLAQNLARIGVVALWSVRDVLERLEEYRFCRIEPPLKTNALAQLSLDRTDVPARLRD